MMTDEYKILEELKNLDGQIAKLLPIVAGADEPETRYQEIIGDWPDSLLNEYPEPKELRKSARQWEQAASDAYLAAERIEKIEADAKEAEDEMDRIVSIGKELAEKLSDETQSKLDYEWLY